MTTRRQKMKITAMVCYDPNHELRPDPRQGADDRRPLRTRTREPPAETRTYAQQKPRQKQAATQIRTTDKRDKTKQSSRFGQRTGTRVRHT